MVENFDEWFHDILENANITDSRYPIKGMAIWMPYGFQIRKHSMNIIKKLLDKDHEEVLFPMLVPESELAKEGIHVKGFEDEVYWVTKGGQKELNEQLALRPTSETAIYPMYALWIRTHMDLPIKYYQIVNTINFSVPNTKEDIMEFMILAASNIDVKKGVDDDVTKAWISKLDQVYQRAEISMGGHPDFAQIKSIYDRKKKELKNKKIKGFLIGAGCVAGWFFLIGLLWNQIGRASCRERV